MIAEYLSIVACSATSESCTYVEIVNFRARIYGNETLRYN